MQGSPKLTDYENYETNNLKVNLLEEDKPNLSTKSSALQWVYGVCKGLNFIKKCKGCPEKVFSQCLQGITEG